LLLAQNRIIADTAVMTAEMLPKVTMPARTRFVPDNRKGRLLTMRTRRLRTRSLKACALQTAKGERK
jgi:hypothetical protein